MGAFMYSPLIWLVAGFLNCIIDKSEVMLSELVNESEWMVSVVILILSSKYYYWSLPPLPLFLSLFILHLALFSPSSSLPCS